MHAKWKREKRKKSTTTTITARKTQKPDRTITLCCVYIPCLAMCVSVHGFTHHLFFKDWSLVYPRHYFIKSLYLRVLFHSLSFCLFCFLSFTPATSFYSLLIPFSFISLGYFCMLAQCVDRFWLLILMPSLLLVCFRYCLTAASVWSSKREEREEKKHTHTHRRLNDYFESEFVWI